MGGDRTDFCLGPTVCHLLSEAHTDLGWGASLGDLLSDGQGAPDSERWEPRPHSQQVAGLGFKPRQSGSKALSFSTKPGCLGRVLGETALGFALVPLLSPAHPGVSLH